MKHTECKDCKLRNGDCGHHFEMNGKKNYDIPRLSSCDRYGNCEFFQQKERQQGEYKIACNVLLSLEQIVKGSEGWEDSAVEAVHNAVQTAIKCMSWIPIKTRQGTDEEYEEFSLYGDCPREDFRVFDCPTPDDEQEVLVTTRWGDVCIDTWHRDVDCCYFENNSDDDDVIAWMPMPVAYKPEVQDD